MPRIVQNIYDELQVPPNLQKHMLRVASVGAVIVDGWVGPRVDPQRITRVLLVHDLGNIVKGDYDAHPEMLEEECHRVGYWKEIQKRYIEMYGRDDHQVSRILGAEIGLTDDELALLDAKVFVKNDETLHSTDFERKIAAYADQRVGPFGVMPLIDRLREAQRRHARTPGASMNNPRTELFIECAIGIERQIKQWSAVVLDDITEMSILDSCEQMRHFKM